MSMKIIERAIRADIPVCLWGAPGTGKTAAVLAAAAEADAYCEVLIGSTMDPTDIVRYALGAEGVEEHPPPWARRLVDASAVGLGTWLFLDELTCAPPSVQAALLRVVNERRVGGLDLSGVRMLAAANPPEQAADGYDLSAATSNRWCHVGWEPNLDEWIGGELSGWGRPDPALEAARADVCAYLGVHSSALLDPPKEGADVRGWPSPRSWSAVARLGSGAPAELVAGLVGPGAAAEFHTWLSTRDLPDPMALLDRRASVPDRGDQAFAALTSCVAAAITRNRQPQLWSLLRDSRPDIALVMLRRAKAAAKRTELVVTPDLDVLSKLAVDRSPARG